MADPVSLDELHTLLICEELALEENQPATSLTEPTSTAFSPSHSTSSQRGNYQGSTSHRGRGRGRGSGSGPGRGRGRGSHINYNPTQAPSQSPQKGTSTNRPICQICNRMGHLIIDCYRHMNHAYQGRVPPQRVMAMIANQSPITDQPWYTDSGASHHITSDLANLSVHSEYEGGDTILFGNGQGLSIAHTGSSQLHTPSHNFHLTNILHCPTASTNLLSVHKFSKDNNCYFLFDDTGFIVRDKKSGKILFQRQTKCGLYPFHPTTNHINKNGPSAFHGERVPSSI